MANSAFRWYCFYAWERMHDFPDDETDESYNALVIDATKGKPIFKKNFESILKIN